MTPKAEKDALWKDLKLQWSFLKRDSGADEVKKGEAKKRINEIQESLKLEKTNWDAPRQGAPGSHLTNAGAAASPSNNALVEKMVWFIENPNKTELMGLASRQIIKERFDVRKVNDKILEIIRLH